MRSGGLIFRLESAIETVTALFLARAMIAKPSYSNLATEIAVALAQHFKLWVVKHPNDEIYAYVIYATPLISTIGVSVLTEQGLEQVAREYETDHGYSESVAELRQALRWSVADTPYCADIHEPFEAVNERLQSMMAYADSLENDDPAWSAHHSKLNSILVEALRQFRDRCLNDELRPMLYVDYGDMSDEERLWFIERCNSRELLDWYRAEGLLVGLFD